MIVPGNHTGLLVVGPLQQCRHEGGHASCDGAAIVARFKGHVRTTHQHVGECRGHFMMYRMRDFSQQIGEVVRHALPQ